MNSGSLVLAGMYDGKILIMTLVQISSWAWICTVMHAV